MCVWAGRGHVKIYPYKKGGAMFSTMLKGGGGEGVIQTFEVVLTQDTYLSHAEGGAQQLCNTCYPKGFRIRGSTPDPCMMSLERYTI